MITRIPILLVSLAAMLGMASCTATSVPTTQSQLAMQSTPLNHSPSHAELFASGMEGTSSTEWTNRTY